jgi:hypothetical protein
VGSAATQESRHRRQGESPKRALAISSPYLWGKVSASLVRAVPLPTFLSWHLEWNNAGNMVGWEKSAPRA